MRRIPSLRLSIVVVSSIALLASCADREPVVEGKTRHNVTALIIPPQPDTVCLNYPPMTAVVRGTLEKRTHPGPPNYQSIERGDTAVESYYLNLHRPVCVNQGEYATDRAEKSVGGVHMVVDGTRQPRADSLIGRRVEVRGRLSHTNGSPDFLSPLMMIADPIAEDGDEDDAR